VLDPDGEVANWNAGAERIKGYAASEVLGRHFSRFYTPEDFETGPPSTARRDGRYEAEG
jgi:PAS domain S-box-containing protein